jgi:hypothetical protein
VLTEFHPGKLPDPLDYVRRLLQGGRGLLVSYAFCHADVSGSQYGCDVNCGNKDVSLSCKLCLFGYVRNSLIVSFIKLIVIIIVLVYSTQITSREVSAQYQRRSALALSRSEGWCSSGVRKLTSVQRLVRRSLMWSSHSCQLDPTRGIELHIGSDKSYKLSMLPKDMSLCIAASVA